jgi:UDP-N-acetylmuramate--alanine ligase
MLEAGGVDPSVIVGAEIPGYGVGARAGGSDVLVLEADESDGTVDVLPLHSVIITNVDVDHLDYFGTFENVQKCFIDVAARATGYVVVNADDAGSEIVVSSLANHQTLKTFGTSADATVRVSRVESTTRGLAIRFVIDGDELSCDLPLRGVHNAMNCAAALAMATSFGVEPRVACAAVENFSGVARRFTERGEFGGALLVDDYAHLPAEIEAAIAAVRTHPSLAGRVVAVFQPNRFHRIAAMAETYSDCFHGADHVIITDVYASGTERIEGVTGEMVSRAIHSAHPELSVVYASTRQDIVNELRGLLQRGDICVSMGCGDIETLPDDLMESR